MKIEVTDENFNDVEEQEFAQEISTEDAEDSMENRIKEGMEKLRFEAMALGSQAVLSVILNKVILYKKKNISRRDLERICKDVEQFCRTGLSKTVQLDGTVTDETSPFMLSVQDD